MVFWISMTENLSDFSLGACQCQGHSPPGPNQGQLCPSWATFSWLELIGFFFSESLSAFHCSCSVCSKTDNMLILWNVLGHLQSTGNLLLSVFSYHDLLYSWFSPELVLLICISYCKREAGMMDHFCFIPTWSVMLQVMCHIHYI